MDIYNTEPKSFFSFFDAPVQKFVEIEIDPPTEEEAKPYFVCIRGNGYIPVSLLVFGRSGEHALHRVLESLQMVVEKGEKETCSVRVARKILQELEVKTMTASVQPFDVRKIACQVIWSSNGGL